LWRWRGACALNRSRAVPARLPAGGDAYLRRTVVKSNIEVIRRLEAQLVSDDTFRNPIVGGQLRRAREELRRMKEATGPTYGAKVSRPPPERLALSVDLEVRPGG
jgi:hypothetical protein